MDFHLGFLGTRCDPSKYDEKRNENVILVTLLQLNFTVPTEQRRQSRNFQVRQYGGYYYQKSCSMFLTSADTSSTFCKLKSEN